MPSGGVLIGEIAKGFITGFWKDLKLIPHTALSAAMLWVVAWGSYLYVYPQVVQARGVVAKFDSLSAKVDRLTARLIKEDLEREISKKDTEIYELEREIEQINARGQTVPESMHRRLRELKNERASKERELNGFLRSNSELLQPQI